MAEHRVASLEMQISLPSENEAERAEVSTTALLDPVMEDDEAPEGPDLNTGVFAIFQGEGERHE